MEPSKLPNSPQSTGRVDWEAYGQLPKRNDFVEPRKRSRIFISYCRADVEEKNHLAKHLNVEDGDAWDDSQIAAGANWLQEIQAAMQSAMVAILLVTKDALNSTFIRREEIAQLLRRRREEGLVLIPVLLRACNHQRVAWLQEVQEIQWRPLDRKQRLRPVIEDGSTQARIDDDFAVLAREVSDILAKSTQPGGQPRFDEPPDQTSDVTMESTSSLVHLLHPSRWAQRHAVFKCGLARLSPELQEAIPLGAIPRVLNATTLAVALRKQGEEADTGLMDELTKFRFVQPRREGAYAYEPSTRAMLIAEWKADQAKQALYGEINRNLAEFHWKAFEARGSAAPENRRGAIQTTDADGCVDSQAELAEAFHHQGERSAQAVFDFFVEKFEQYSDRERYDACVLLVRLAREALRNVSEKAQTRSLHAWMKYYEARLLRLQKRLPEAETRLRDLVAAADDDKRLKLWGLSELGDVLNDQGRFDDARENHQAGLALAQETRADDYNLPVWYGRIAGLASWLDEFEAAASGHRTTIQLARQYGNSQAELQARLELSSVLQSCGKWSEAWEAGLEALHLARTELRHCLPVQRSVAQHFMNLVACRDPKLLDTLFVEAEAMLEPGEHRARLELGRLYGDCLRKGGQFGRAEGVLLDMLTDSGKHVDNAFTLNCLLSQAMLYRTTGRLTEAHESCTKLLGQGDGTFSARAARAEGLLERAQLFIKTERWTEAESFAQKAVEAWQELRFTKRSTWARVHAARAAKQRDWKEATATVRDASLSLAGAVPYLGDLHKLRGDLCRDQDRWAEASEQYQQAMTFYESLDLIHDVIATLDAWADTAFEQGDRAESNRLRGEAATRRASLDRMNVYRPARLDREMDALNGQGMASFCRDDQQDATARAEHARTLFARASAATPPRFWSLLNTAYAGAAAQDWKSAAGALQEAVDARPEYVPPPLLRLLTAWRTRQLDLVHGEAMAAWKGRDAELARDRFVAALEINAESFSNAKDRQADLHVRLAVVESALGHAEEALTAFAAALPLVREGEPGHGPPALGNSSCAMLRDLADYLYLDAQMGEWARQLELDDDQLALMRTELVKFLDTSQRLALVEEPTQPPPIVLEIGSDMIPTDTRTDTWSLFKTLIPEMRQRVLTDTGVQPPGVRVRRSSMAPNAYRISLFEVPVRNGAVRTGKVYCLASHQALQASGIAAEASDEAMRPDGEGLGCWLISEHQQAARSAGYEVWDDPLMFVIRQVESVVRRHLSELFDDDNALQLIDTWRAAAPMDRPASRLLFDESTARRLARALRRLVAEAVPIKARDPLLAAFEDGETVEATETELCRLMRLSVKEALPGTGPGYRRLLLPNNWEARLQGHLDANAANGGQDLPPLDYHELAATLRDLLPAGGPKPAMVVRNPRLRTLVHCVLDAEYPDVPVLAANELLDHGADREAPAVSAPTDAAEVVDAAP